MLLYGSIIFSRVLANCAETSFRSGGQYSYSDGDREKSHRLAGSDAHEVDFCPAHNTQATNEHALGSGSGNTVVIATIL